MSRDRKSLSGAWFDLAFNSIALMQDSVFVIGKRTAAMAAAGGDPPAAQKREMRRMVEEKVSASAESLTRLAWASAVACQSMVINAMFAGRPPDSTEFQRAAIRVLGAAAAPYRTRVRANAKRLRRH